MRITAEHAQQLIRIRTVQRKCERVERNRYKFNQSSRMQTTKIPQNCNGMFTEYTTAKVLRHR